jgi:hypothetical protein
VSLDHNAILWQRRAGFSVQGAQLTAVVHPAANKARQEWGVLAWNRGGDLLSFDPAKPFRLVDKSWQLSGRPLLRDQPGAGWLLPHADGQTVVALTVQGPEAKIWKWRDGIVEPLGKSHWLEAPLAGTPALLGDAVVLPLANGRLMRCRADRTTSEDDWRSQSADKTAAGYPVAIDPGRLACTDGGQGLTVWRLEGDSLSRVNTVDVRARILSRAAVLPNAGPASEFRLCVADASRTVTLFQSEMLRKVREWPLSDTISAGPFVRGDSIYVAVRGRRLVCLDPNQKEPRWAHTFRADIVGEPQLINGALIVADESGQIQALDPATGEPLGLGYTIRAAVAPAAAPMPYGADQLFVPLTDGTVMLLSRAWFRPTLLGVQLRR